MSAYAKAIVALALAALNGLQAAITDGAITQQEWIGIGIAVLTAIGVWLVPNKAAKV